MLPGGETLLSATVRRTRGLVPIGDTFVVTTAEQVPEVRRCLPDLPLANILVEPVGRNTAPCIGLAALAVLRRAADAGDADATMAVLPSDHYVQNEAVFQELLREALANADRGSIVTIGIRPTKPETGYGYIKLAAPLSGKGTAASAPPIYIADAFVEKPSHERAAEYLAAGNYLWNSGMFFFPARRILTELHHYLPPLGTLLDDLAKHPEHIALRYAEAPAISIDYAVMEKLGAASVGAEAAIRVLCGDFGWNDVGSFSALSALITADPQGNHVVAERPTAMQPILLDAHHNTIWNSSRQLIAAVGVDELVIAVTEDAVLVLPKERAQEVRDVVARLQASGRSELL
jgi:mannose-1-phosphate guanylyltransferase